MAEIVFEFRCSDPSVGFGIAFRDLFGAIQIDVEKFAGAAQIARIFFQQLQNLPGQRSDAP